MDSINKINTHIKNIEQELKGTTDDARRYELEQALEKLLLTFSNVNVGNRNEDVVTSKAAEMLKQEHTLIKKTKTFLYSEHKRAIITAPTQVGKSEAIGWWIKQCLREKVSCIVSCDNKTDQQEQMCHRLRGFLVGSDVELILVNDGGFASKLTKCFADNRRFVVLCLDNAAQIKKLGERIIIANTSCNKQIKQIQKVVLIHDEGDTIAKHHNTETHEDEQAKSHKGWLDICNYFKSSLGHIDLKKVFVTATLENCCALYDVKSDFVISLEVPSGYQGWKQMEYNVIDGDMEIGDILQKEVERINSGNSHEAIIYNVERSVGEKGHSRALRDCATLLKDITIHTYNGQGMEVYTRNEALRQKLRVISYEKINKKGNAITKNVKSSEANGYVKLSKKVTIRKFYTLCKETGEKVVLTIGKDLISRGISYVSECDDLPLAATTMIYIPGSSMHAVGIVQTVGRITGCARSDLKRRLYAPADVIKTYKGSNINKEKLLLEISKKPEESTKAVIDSTKFEEKLSRPIDRSKLQMEGRFSYEEQTERVHAKGTLERLIDLWWKADTTIIGKIFMFVYESEMVSEGELREFISESGSGNVESHYQEPMKSDRGHNLVFNRCENKITRLTDEAKNYIITKKNYTKMRESNDKFFEKLNEKLNKKQ
jgi:hypothetical protein